MKNGQKLSDLLSAANNRSIHMFHSYVPLQGPPFILNKVCSNVSKYGYTDTQAQGLSKLVEEYLCTNFPNLESFEINNSPFGKTILEKIPGYILSVLKKFQGAYLAGGAILAPIMGKPVNDYDFFFLDRTTLINFCEYLSQRGFVPVISTPNAITMRGRNGDMVQAVSNHYYWRPECCISSFDYDVCKFALHHNGTMLELVTDRAASTSIASKVLTYSGSSPYNLLSTLQRAMKFAAKYGLVMNRESAVKLMEQIHRGSIITGHTFNVDKDDYTLDMSTATSFPNFWSDEKNRIDVLGSFSDKDSNLYNLLFYATNNIKHTVETCNDEFDDASLESVAKVCYYVNRVASSKQIKLPELDSSICDDMPKSPRRGKSAAYQYLWVGNSIKTMQVGEGYMSCLKLLKHLEYHLDSARTEALATDHMTLNMDTEIEFPGRTQYL